MAELNRLYSPNFEKQLNTLKQDFNELKGDLVTIAKGLKSVDNSLRGVAKSQDNLNKERKEAEKLKQEAIRTDSLLLKKKQEIKKVQLAQQKVIAQATRNAALERREKEQLIKAEQRQQRELEKQNSAYQKLNRTLGTARKHAKEMAATYGLASKQFLVAQKRVTALDTKIKKIDGSLGLHQRNVGNYAGGLKSVAGAMGLAVGGAALLAAGIRKVGQAIAGSIRLWSEFDSAASQLQAVTGATSEDMRLLVGNAERLGATTQKTAKDVLGLSIEFAKLGFTTQEIDAATEATLKLSIAAGADLAESAVVAASTVRGFGLDAKDTQKVVDVMAKSFTSSALDMEKFKTAMAIVAPVAKASGQDIEFASAQLSILADAGVDASTAGTSLRNMFLELNKKGLTWEEGLQKINESTNKNVTALDLFGKRGATAALILADNTDKAERLETAYDNAAGSAQRMANIMADNLAGDAAAARSAMEGLGISIGRRLNDSLRGATQLWTKLLGGMNELVRIEASDEIRKEAVELSSLVRAASDANTSQEARNTLLTEIQTKYPDFLGNLDAEKATNEQLRDRLAEVNTEYQKKIELAVQDEIIADEQDRLVQLQADEVDLLKQKQEVFKQLEAQYERQGLEFTEEIWKQNWAYRDFNRALEHNREKQAEVNEEIQENLSIYQELNKENQAAADAEAERLKAEKEAAALEKEKQDKAMQDKRLQEEAEKKAAADAKAAKKAAQEEIALMNDKISLMQTQAKLSDNDRETAIKLAEIQAQQLEANDKRLEQELISEDKHKENKLKIAEEYRQGLKEINDKIKSDTEELHEGLLDAEKELDDMLDEMFEEDFEREQEANDTKEEQEFDKAKAITDSANVVFSVTDSLRQRQLERLEADHEANLLRIGDDEQARIEAERNYQIEKAKLERKEAIASKAKALFDIGINTAVAVTELLGRPIMMAIAIATGIAQAAAVLAKPLPAIPEFDKGTKAAPKGMIAVAEKRPEIVNPKQGSPFLLTQPLLTDQLTGAEIIGGAETQRILGHTKVLNTNDNAILLNDGLNRIDKSIRGMKIEYGFNAKGQAYVIRKERNKTTYANYYKS